MTETSSKVFRYFAYTLEIIVLYVLGATPKLLPEIFGAKPTLLVCAAVTIAVFEREIPAMIFGLFCGLLLDVGYAGTVGVFTVTLTAVCFLIGFLANNVIMATFPNFLICSALVTAVAFMLYFLFSYVWAGVPDAANYFKNHMISRMVQTFVFSIPFYFLNRFVYETLNGE